MYSRFYDRSCPFLQQKSYDRVVLHLMLIGGHKDEGWNRRELRGSMSRSQLESTHGGTYIGGQGGTR